MSEEEKKIEETPEAAAPEAEAPKEETPAEAPTEEASAPAEEEKAEEPETEPEPETPAHPEVKPGMVIRVHETIKDVNAKGEEKIRVQVFEGIVMGVKNAGIARTATVRKDSGGVMVEKIYPLASPNIEKIEVVKEHKVRRAKLGFLRGRFKRKMKEVK